MLALIIEPHITSAERLRSNIEAIQKDISFLPVVSTITESLHVLMSVEPDFIFVNIVLTEEQGFELFRKQAGAAAIIFIKRYDYATDGIVEEHNVTSILKDNLRTSLKEVFHYLETTRKLRSISDTHVNTDLQITGKPQYPFRTRFLFRQGQKMIPVKSTEINHFVSEGSLVYVVTCDKRRYVADESLNELDNKLNPSEFFRVNRKFILAKDSILSLDYYAKGQVAIRAHLLETERLVVSRQQTPIIKAWLSQ